ncbi:MAG TPA: 4-(cytidine 5'-diphospho)-2-C-methyl-D-erythritol kinase [Acidobacteriaceae bacterium]
MPTRVRSFSKINLGLAIGPARADGFHALTTAYQTLALHDIVTITARPSAATEIHLTANHPGVPRSETNDADRNTAYKMVDSALRRLGITAAVSIDIDKRLPVQGGLGAGSANAAAALLGLEHELSQHFSPEPSALDPEPWSLGPGPWTLGPVQRLALAAEIGSDVPLFLLGGTVLGLGRGEEVYPLPDLPATPCVLALPEIGVSTAAAFRALDERIMAHITPALSSRPERDSLIVPRSGETRSSPLSAPELTSSSSPDRLKELSCALAAVWTATGADLGNPSGTRSAPKPSPTGIASTIHPDESHLSSGNPPPGGAPASQEYGRSDLAETLLLALVRTGIENDFEEVVFQQHPSLRSTKRDLMGSGSSQALYAALSGSGSVLFGLYRSQADARAAQQRVQSSGTRALLTETLPRPEYWRTMLKMSLQQ